MNKNLFNVFNDSPRHWSPISEHYTGCDSLLTAIDNGWTPSKTVFVQYHGTSGRITPIYYFYLIKRGEMRKMRVIHSPYVGRIMEHFEINLLQRRQSHQTGAVERQVVNV